MSVCVCVVHMCVERHGSTCHTETMRERERERERERQCAEVQCCVLEDVQRLRPGHF